MADPAAGSPEPAPAPGLPATIALYVVARLALVVVVAALLSLVGVPLLIAVLVAIIMALPLSLVLFKGLRARLDLAVAAAGKRRSAERATLRARLRGEEPSSADEPAQGQADAGQH